MIPKNYISSCRRNLDGCWNCKYSFEDFNLLCYLTCESLETFSHESSFLSMFYVEEMGICDNWKLKDEIGG